MSRRKITEEAEKNTEKESSGSSERKKLTQRMPEDLVEDVDEFAERNGMPRNAAINMLVREALRNRE